MKQGLQLATLCALLAGTLAGCARLGASATDRINQAMPLAADTQAAKAALDRLAVALDTRVPQLEAEYRAKLGSRALQCSHGYAPSIWTGDDSIRAELVDRQCFDDADDRLREWLGHQRIALLLAAPPLRPVPERPSAVLAAPAPIVEADFAERAGVALLQTRAEYLVVDMASGKPIHTGRHPRGSVVTGLSPNGRMFVSGSGDDAEIRESASGDLLATFDDVRAYQLYWASDVGAYYMAQSGRTPMFFDFAAARATSIPMSPSMLDHVAPLSGAAPRHALVGFNRIAVVELRREPQGWLPVLSTEIHVSGDSWARNTTGLTADRSALYGIGRDLKLVDTATAKVRSLSFEPMRLQRAVATPDADKLLLCGFYRDAPGVGSDCFVYSIGQRSAAQVTAREVRSSRLAYIPSLRRNAIIDRMKVMLLDPPATGVAEPVGAYLARRSDESVAIARIRGQIPAETHEVVDAATARAAMLARIEAGNPGMVSLSPLPASTSSSVQALAPLVAHPDPADGADGDAIDRGGESDDRSGPG